MIESLLCIILYIIMALMALNFLDWIELQSIEKRLNSAEITFLSVFWPALLLIVLVAVLYLGFTYLSGKVRIFKKRDE